MDFIIIDTLPKNQFEKLLQRILLLGIYGLAMGHRYKIQYSEYNLPMKIATYILQLCGKRIPIKKLVKWYNNISSMYNNRPYNEVFRSNATPPYLNRRFKRSWYSKAVEGSIKDQTYSIPVGSKKILRALYGNYMQLPPEHEREPSHVQCEFVNID